VFVHGKCFPASSLFVVRPGDIKVLSLDRFKALLTTWQGRLARDKPSRLFSLFIRVKGTKAFDIDFSC